MAGHTIGLYFHENGYKVVGFSREKSRVIPSIVGDVSDLKGLINVINNGQYDAIVNCIGLLNEFAEQNKPNAVFLNSFLPHKLAEITKNIPTKIVHISTDCVFSGKTGNYSENSLRDGPSFYDRSKALGELEDNKNLTLRNSIVGPDIKKNGIGLLNWFMQQSGEIKGYTKSLWTGQTTLQLAKTIEAALKQGAVGLINAVPDEIISKYDLLKLFNKHLRNDSIEIYPVEGIVQNKTLVRNNLSLNYWIPDYEVMIEELAKWIKQHKWLYPHYESI